MTVHKSSKSKKTSKETPHVEPADLQTQKVDPNGIFDAFQCDATHAQGHNATNYDKTKNHVAYIIDII